MLGGSTQVGNHRNFISRARQACPRPPPIWLESGNSLQKKCLSARKIPMTIAAGQSPVDILALIREFQ